MMGIIGLVVVFAMVFGGYLAAGGHMEVILHSLPFELMIIGGAAVGAFLISNAKQVITGTLKSIAKVFKGSKWTQQDYQDLLCLMFELIKIARNNPVALDQHIETPDESPIFSRYPKLQGDHHVVDLICDTLRSATMNYDDPHQVEDLLEKRLSALRHHSEEPSHALQVMADGLPALGIVAAVLGVIKTMSSIDKPPEVLGGMIGGALVGTFLGVFMAYGIVGPFAARLKAVSEDEMSFYELVKDVLLANMHNHAPNICVEVGRQNTPEDMRPTFDELSNALRGAAA
ncbi:flagellar motor stator protein MotA [Paracoccaceae bacterium GXU_MW_L88]